MKKFDVAIIGGGVVGGLIARELARYKLNICILEAQGDVAMGATKANSDIVHAGFDAKVGSLKAKFNVLGSEMMENAPARPSMATSASARMVPYLKERRLYGKALRHIC